MRLYECGLWFCFKQTKHILGIEIKKHWICLICADMTKTDLLQQKQHDGGGGDVYSYLRWFLQLSYSWSDYRIISFEIILYWSKINIRYIQRMIRTLKDGGPFRPSLLIYHTDLTCKCHYYLDLFNVLHRTECHLKWP